MHIGKLLVLHFIETELSLCCSEKVSLSNGIEQLPSEMVYEYVELAE
ncbi:hypothetical protein AB4254_08095 [Vibrio breoganii]